MNGLKSNVTLITFLILLLAALVITFIMIGPLLPYIFLGGILAILLNPLDVIMKRRGWGPKLAAFILTLGVFLIVAGPFSFFSTRALKQGISFGQRISEGGTLSVERSTAWLQKRAWARILIGDPATIEVRSREIIQNAGKTISTFFLDAVTELPSIVLHSIIALITCFFFLIDGGRFVSWFADKIPLDQDVRKGLMDAFKGTSVSVVWATLAGAFAQAVVILIGFLILQVPAAFFAGGAAFVFAWLPLVGTSPVWIGGCIYLLTQHMYAKVVILVAIGLFAGVTDNVVRPMVLKGRSDMHPVVSLIAVFGGIRLFGLLGIFYGPIIASLVIALLQVWPVVGNRSGLYFGMTPRDMSGKL